MASSDTNTDVEGGTPAFEDVSDGEVDALLDRVIERAQERDDIQINEGGLLARLASQPASRRQALKALGAGAAVGVTGGAASTEFVGQADAGTQQEGTQGEAGRPIDVVAEDIYGPGGEGSNDPVGFEKIDADEAVVGIEDTNNPGLPLLSNKRTSAPRSLTVQPDDGDAAGSVEIFPSGTIQRSHYLAATDPDPNNFGFIELEAAQNEGWIDAGQKGTGTAPTQFKFWNFPDGVRFQDNVAMGADITPTRPLHITHSGASDGAIRVGDDDTPGNNTGIYLRSTGRAIVRSANGAELALWNDTSASGPFGVLIRDSGRVQLNDFLQLTKRSSSISAPEEGDVAFADGTNWNPGSGSGVYVYDGGAWQYLGGAGSV